MTAVDAHYVVTERRASGFLLGIERILDTRTDEQRRYGVPLAPPRTDPGTQELRQNAVDYVTDEHLRYGALDVIPSQVFDPTTLGPTVAEGDLTDEHVRYGVTSVGVRAKPVLSEEHKRYGALNVK